MHLNILLPGVAFATTALASPVALEPRACTPWTISCLAVVNLTLCNSQGDEELIVKCAGTCQVIRLDSSAATAMCVLITTITWGRYGNWIISVSREGRRKGN